MHTLKRTLKTIPVDLIDPWPNNPQARVREDAQFLEMLAHIKQVGQIDPIDLVVTDSERYKIVRGHRRFKAIAGKLSWPFIESWVWFEPFEAVLAKLFPTERMQRRYVGQDIGQATNALGIETVSPLLRLDDARVLQWAAAELAVEPELFRWLCERFGPRVFRVARRCIGEDWPLVRVCRAMRLKGDYRDLEEKGADRPTRQGLLGQWEQAA